jgi:beta-glucuronidase
MLRPQSTASRELVSLDGLWNFDLVRNVPKDDQEWAASLSPKTRVPVPASYNDIFLDPEIRNHVGWAKYQRQVCIPQGWTGRRYFVRCDAATHRGKVFINEKETIDHSGGYTPFDVEVTQLVKAGEDFRLTIAVSNELPTRPYPRERYRLFQTDARSRRTFTTSSTTQALHDLYGCTLCLCNISPTPRLPQMLIGSIPLD